ncbi:hypothetical protein ES705_41205 [subsurface metagenome]
MLSSPPAAVSASVAASSPAPNSSSRLTIESTLASFASPFLPVSEGAIFDCTNSCIFSATTRAISWSFNNRNSSLAVFPINCLTRVGSVTPASSIIILFSPCCWIIGSATPNSSTRFVRISIALVTVSSVCSLKYARTSSSEVNSREP